MYMKKDYESWNSLDLNMLPYNMPSVLFPCISLKFHIRTGTFWSKMLPGEGAPFCPSLLYSCPVKLLLLRLILVLMGVWINPVSFIYFFTKKNSLIDHNLRPTCKFLILAIFYNAKKFKKYKKFYNISLKKNNICGNNRKNNKIIHCVDFFLSCSFDDMGIFHVFQLSFDGGGGVISTHNR